MSIHIMRAAVTVIFAAFALILLALIAYLASGQARSEYAMECVRATDRCTLAQRRGSGSTRADVAVHAIDSAGVVVVRARRSARVFLELFSGPTQTFAAEYEG